MDLSGEQIIRASRAAVWQALNDPAILAAGLEGCQKLERTSADSFEGTMAAKVGPVRATFQGKVTLSDIDPPNGYTITGEGQGGVAGFAKGSATVALADAEGGGTCLRYAAKANVGGKLAQVGARLIESVAKQHAESFFEKFKTLVEAPESAAETEALPDAAAGADATADAAPAASHGVPAWAWGGLVGAAIALLLYVLLT